MKNILLTIALLTMLSGCATTLPMSSNVNDFVLMGTELNNADSIKYTLNSSVIDGEITPSDQNGTTGQHPGFIHNETRVFSRMVTEYMSSKFTNLSKSSGDVSIHIDLNKLSISQYVTNSDGEMWMVMLAGGEITQILTAKVVGKVSVTINGAVHVKKIVASSENTFISGMGTGTSTSNIHRGKQSIQHVHAENINKANNKFLMQINSFFEELEL